MSSPSAIDTPQIHFPPPPLVPVLEDQSKSTTTQVQKDADAEMAGDNSSEGTLVSSASTADATMDDAEIDGAIMVASPTKDQSSVFRQQREFSITSDERAS